LWNEKFIEFPINFSDIFFYSFPFLLLMTLADVLRIGPVDANREEHIAELYGPHENIRQHLQGELPHYAACALLNQRRARKIHFGATLVAGATLSSGIIFDQPVLYALTAGAGALAVYATSAVKKRAADIEFFESHMIPAYRDWFREKGTDVLLRPMD
jgi:hypothetical protein